MTAFPVEPVAGDVVALLVPAQNYILAGNVFGAAYQTLFSAQVDCIVIAVRSDKKDSAVVIPISEKFITPLGVLPAEERAANLLAQKLDFVVKDAACPPDQFWYQLPFIQYIFADKPVLLLELGELSLGQLYELSDTLSSVLGERRALVVGVTNLAAAGDFPQISRLDKVAIVDLQAMDLSRLWSDIGCGRAQLSCPCCAAFAVLMAQRLGASCGKLLRHAATVGLPAPKRVGLASVAWFTSSPRRTAKKVQISPAWGRKLWELAAATVLGKPEPEIPTPLERISGGVFISVSDGDSTIARVGELFTNMSLPDAVRRFASMLLLPVRMCKLSRGGLCGFILSVCVAEPVDDVSVPGPEVGIYVRRGANVGVLLPGEASDMSPQARLERACLQAGMFSKSWRSPETDVHFFRVTVFSDTLR